MAVATLTSKGQITIPHEIRGRLRLKAGDRIEFRVEEGGSVTLLPLARRMEEVFGILSGHAGRKSVPVEKMDRLLADSFRRRQR